MSIEHHQFIASYRGQEFINSSVQENFYKLFADFTSIIDLDCDEELASFNGFYGYTTYDSVQYFETIALHNPPPPSSIPSMQYQFYRFIIVINHFNDEMTSIENIEEGTESRIDEINTIIDAQSFNTHDFQMIGEESSNCTDDDFRECVTKAKLHCNGEMYFNWCFHVNFNKGLKVMSSMFIEP